MNELQRIDSLWFKLRSIEKVQSGDWLYSLGYLSSHLLLVNVDGEAQMTVNGSLLRLEPGCAFICLSGDLLSITPSKDGNMFVMEFDTLEDKNGLVAGLEVTKGSSSFLLQGSISLSDAATAEALSCRALLDWRSEGMRGRMKAQAVFYELLGLLLEEASSEAKPAEEALLRTIAYMERHYDRNITIDELAELAGLSRYYYMRLFKSSYGISTMDYLTELRMNKARRLMEVSKPKLREIARQVGYSDEFYFIRKFKQQVGIPPATYIRNRERRIAAYSFPNIGQLLALQIVPFAAPMDQGWTDLYRRKYQTDIVTELSHNYEFNLAALRAAQPDYIIGVDAFLPPEEQERIRAIAPSLFVPWGKDDWRGHLRSISEFLDMTQEADAWLRKYEKLAAEVRRRFQSIAGQETVLVVHLNKEGYNVYGSKTVAGVLYEDLGLLPAGWSAGIDYRETVELEQLAQFGADRILLMFPRGEDIQVQWERLQHSEPWKQQASMLSSKVTPIAFWPWFDYSAFSQAKFLAAAPAIFGL
ncbi:helix-turn-helix domain-containing protein [Paenibacillus eucommiae]|uniref:AraC-like DNA-binding protein n=1 Tax=Paenibacillus eucommiae TaxID=1355755 RepID=A0ABS4IWV0_9BACL|nr:AraC family transcriptional regulator [Paenibacillus eucommiae]MBP1992064.1 AraC-like DNA-binding protein [Paenibacillus eucommiae]